MDKLKQKQKPKKLDKEKKGVILSNMVVLKDHQSFICRKKVIKTLKHTEKSVSR